MVKIGDYELNNIYCMDCVEGMKNLPDASIDLVVTSPRTIQLGRIMDFPLICMQLVNNYIVLLKMAELSPW